MMLNSYWSVKLTHIINVALVDLVPPHFMSVPSQDMYFQLFVSGSYLIYVICVCLRIVVSNTCCVVCLALFVFFLGFMYSMLQLLWFVNYWLAQSLFSSVFFQRQMVWSFCVQWFIQKWVLVGCKYSFRICGVLSNLYVIFVLRILKFG
jgi:hypothetical protein